MQQPRQRWGEQVVLVVQKIIQSMLQRKVLMRTNLQQIGAVMQAGFLQFLRKNITNKNNKKYGQ